MGISRLWITGLLVAGLGVWGQQGGKPVKEIDIIIKKQPSGSSNLVKSDANGGFSVRIPEAGTYSIRFAAPPTLTDLPGTIRASVAFAGDNPAESRISFQKPTPDRRLRANVQKGTRTQRIVPVDSNGLYFYQDVMFSGPGVLSGTLNAHRALTSVEALAFVAVEGQQSPLPQSVSLIGEGYTFFEYSAVLSEGVERRWRVQLARDSGVWRGDDVKPAVTVSVNTEGLPAGTYSDTVAITLRSGEKTETVRLPILIHIRPRLSGLGLITDRKLRVIPQRTGLVRTIVRVTNPSTVEEVLTLGVEEGPGASGITLPSGPIRIAGGQTVEVPIVVDAAQVAERGTIFTSSTSGIKTKFLAFVPPPLPDEPATAPCVASEIKPYVVNQPEVILQGVPAPLDIEVWDNCGVERTDFTILSLSELMPSAAGKAVGVKGVATRLMIQPNDAGSGKLQLEVRSGELTGEDEVDVAVEATPVPSMKAVGKSGAGQLNRPEQPKSLAIAPGAIVEVETTPVSDSAELLFGRIPIRVLSRQGDVFRFRVPYDTDPSVPQVLRIRDDNHTSAAFALPIVPALPTILRNPETGAQSFLRADDGSLTPVTAGTRAAPGSTLVVFADGLGSVDLSATGKAAAGVFRSASGIREGINDGIGAVKMPLGNCPPKCSKITPTEVVFTSDLPVALEGGPEGAFRITFTLPSELESPEPASGRVPFSVESQGVASEMADTYTPNPAPLSAVYVTSQAIPYPAAHLWNGVSQASARGASETVGQFLSLEGPTPQPTTPGVRLRLADMVSNVVNSTAPDGTRWDIVVPNSPIQVDYAAVYEKDFQLTLKVNPPACGTLTTGPIASPDNWWPEGSTVPLAWTVNAGWMQTSLAGATTGTSVLMDRPRTVTMNCLQGFPLTLQVNPNATGPATVRINNVPSNTGTMTAVRSGPTPLEVPDGYLVNTVYHVFSSTSTPTLTWSQTAPNVWRANAPAPTAAITYTANYRAACAPLPAIANTNITNGTPFTRPGAPAGCVAVGTNVRMSATPPTGQCFLSWSDGDTANPRTILFPASGTLPTPVFGPCPTTATCAPLPAGPGGWWSMESATPPIRDRMPLGLDALSGGALPTSIPGKVGNALQFNGTNQSLIVPYNSVFDSLQAGPGDGFTVDAWVRLDLPVNIPPGQKTGGSIFSNVRLSGLNGYSVGVDRNNGPALYLNAYRASSGYETFYGPMPITDTNWHFVAVRLKRLDTTGSTELSFWLDGVKKSVVPGGKVPDLTTKVDYYIGCATLPTPCWNNPTTQTPLPIGIGRDSGDSTGVRNYFPGAIDELEYFQRALTDAEIDSIYKAGSVGKCVPATLPRITVNTSPANIGATVGATPLGTATDEFKADVPAATTLALTASSPVTNSSGNTRYVLRTPNTWSVNGTVNPNYSTSPQPIPTPTADTTYTANYTTQYEVKVVVNGTCTVSVQTGFFNSGLLLPVTITPAAGATATWAFVGGSLPLVSGGRVPVLSPGTLTVDCNGAAPSVTVLTNPAGIGAKVGIGSLSGTNTVSGPFPPSSTQTLTADAGPIVSGGTVYTFDTWSPNGPSITTPPAGPGVYTANYKVTGYTVTASGCPTSIGPASLAVLQNPLAFPPNANVTLTANPPTGQTFTNFVVTIGGVSTTLTSSPATVRLTGPATVVTTCSTPTRFPLIVTTTPPNIGVVVGVQGLPTGNGSATDNFSTTAAAGDTGSATATPAQKFDIPATTRWDLKSFTMNGTVNLGLVSPAGFTMPSRSTTIVAAYDTFYKIDVVNNGCGTVSPVAGFYPAGSTVTVSVTAGSGNQVGNITFAPPGGGGGVAAAPIANNSTMPVDSPKILTANCGATPTGVVVVNTNPANLNVTVGLQNVGSQPNVYTSGPLAAGNVTLTANPVGPFVSSLGVRYQLQNWRQGTTVLGPGPTQVAPVVTGTTTTYTAFYEAIGNRVTVVNNGCATTSITPPLPADGILPSSSLINLGATPPAGGTFTNVSLAITDPFTGNVQTVGPLTTVPFLNPIGLTGPTVITFTCAAATNVGVTVNTSPANLGAVVGVGAATAPNTYTANLPASSTQTLTAPATVVTPGGEGYQFTGWTPSGPNVTLPGTGAVTYTANYRLACYMIFTQVQPAGTGTVTLSPASLAGFPTGCYANGTTVTATLTPAAGRIGSSWLPWAGGSGQGGGGPYTFTVTGPGQLTGTTTAAAPDVVITYVSRNRGVINFRATNNGTAAATNYRLTAVRPSGLSMLLVSPTTYPVALGNIAPGASVPFTATFQANPEDLNAATNMAFAVIFSSQADNQAAANTTVQVPLAPQTTVALAAVSRTNAGNVATLVFNVTNTGANPVVDVGFNLSIAGLTGVSFPGGNSGALADIAPGASKQISFTVALPSGQSIATATFTGTLQAFGNLPLTTARWTFTAPATITPLP